MEIMLKNEDFGIEIAIISEIIINFAPRRARSQWKG